MSKQRKLAGIDATSFLDRGFLQAEATDGSGIGRDLMKRIVLTGGGTAGHVTPNLALIPRLLADGWDVHYIGEGRRRGKAPHRRRSGSDVSQRVHGQAAALLRRQKLHRSVQGGEGHRSGLEADETAKARRGLFQGRLRLRARGLRRAAAQGARGFARIGYDAGAGQQALRALCVQDTLHLPGSGARLWRKGRLYRHAHPPGDFERRPRKGSGHLLALPTAGRF